MMRSGHVGRDLTWSGRGPSLVFSGGWPLGIWPGMTPKTQHHLVLIVLLVVVLDVISSDYDSPPQESKARSLVTGVSPVSPRSHYCSLRQLEGRTEHHTLRL